MSTDDDAVLSQPLDMPEATPNSHVPKKRRPILRKLLITLIVLLVIAGLAGGGWYIKTHKDAPSKQTNVTTPAPTTNTAKKDYDPGAIKTYKADVMRLELLYPSAWKVTEADGGVLFTSPSISYQTTDKGSITGNFRVYIRQGSRPQEGKYIGRGMAIVPSEKLVYSQPGADQRKDTNFTTFGSYTADHFTFFMITGDYSLKVGDQLGPNYGHEAETYIIVGGFAAPAQTDILDFNNLSAEQAMANPAYTQAYTMIKSIKID